MLTCVDGERGGDGKFAGSQAQAGQPEDGHPCDLGTNGWEIRAVAALQPWHVVQQHAGNECELGPAGDGQSLARDDLSATHKTSEQRNHKPHMDSIQTEI